MEIKQTPISGFMGVLCYSSSSFDRGVLHRRESFVNRDLAATHFETHTPNPRLYSGSLQHCWGSF